MTIITVSEKSKIDYKGFVSVMAQRHIDRTDVKDAEFEARVKAAYVKGFTHFCDISRLYRVEIPVDLYIGKRMYEVMPPEGWVILSYVKHKNNILTLEPPAAFSYDDNVIYLNFNVKRDIDKAFYGVYAIKPTIDGPCEFNKRFVSLYSDTIADAMSIEMATSQAERTLYQNRFKDEVRSAIEREAFNKPITVKRRGASVL